MSARPLAILRTGLVSPVGIGADETCAALRAKLTNPMRTNFTDAAGEKIMAHEVLLEQPWRGQARLAKMAALALDEALEIVPAEERVAIPLLLCVAEPQRPGRPHGLDAELPGAIRDESGDAAFFPERTLVIAQGRVGVAVALDRARALVHDGGHPRVLVVATDSFVNRQAIAHFEQAGRLLTSLESNGFMPGEAAGALLVGAPDGTPQLTCTGLGFAQEPAPIGSGEPLRAEGLTRAIGSALADAGVALHELDFRITGVSGEQYFFKEAALAYSRTLRRRQEEFDHWHPAECIGESGAASGAAIVALADAACRKGYAKGSAILAHLSNDAGERAAMTLHYRGS